MNQQQLIFIREIARTGTIRGAAACVDRTPSALTRGLKSVENELGCQLFRRIREGMVPTSEGETVLSYGERILKSLQEIKEKRIWSENEIRYLLCIRENKSITGAAETLFIAQPSLSQVLKEAEEEVGFKIFQRDRRGGRGDKSGRRAFRTVRGSMETLEGNAGRTGRIPGTEKRNSNHRHPYEPGGLYPACSGSCVSQALSGGKGIYP